MIFNPTKKQVPCPWCGIDIYLDITKYPLNKKVIEHCPWCGRKVRVKKILRQIPKETRGIKLILTQCKKEGSGRRKNERT